MDPRKERSTGSYADADSERSKVVDTLKPKPEIHEIKTDDSEWEEPIVITSQSSQAISKLNADDDAKKETPRKKSITVPTFVIGKSKGIAAHVDRNPESQVTIDGDAINDEIPVPKLEGKEVVDVKVEVKKEDLDKDLYDSYTKLISTNPDPAEATQLSLALVILAKRRVNII